MSKKVLGIDPGTAITGYGVIETGGRGLGVLLECGVVKTDRKQSLAYRLESLYEGITEIIRKHQPAILSIESVFYGKNPQSTIALAQGRGIALLAASQSNMEIYEFAPAVVKKTVAGTGRANKEQVAYMVQRLLGLKSPPTPSDAADGVALAITFLLHRSLPL